MWLIQSVEQSHAAVEPTAPEPFINTGNVLRIGTAGRPAKIEASRSYRTALRLQPRNYDVLTSLAWLDFSLVRIRVPHYCACLTRSITAHALHCFEL